MLAVLQHFAATADDSEEFYGVIGASARLQRALKAEEQTLLLREALHRIRALTIDALALPGA